MPKPTGQRILEAVRSPRSIPGKSRRLAQRVGKRLRWQCIGTDYIQLSPHARLKVYRDSVLGSLLREREFESVERAFLQAFLQRGDNVVDIGANVGLFAVLAGATVGPTGRVFACEPCSKTFQRLTENIRLNGMSHVLCRRIALSDFSGEASLAVSAAGYDAWNSLAGPLMSGGYTTEQVAVSRWDAIIESNEWPPVTALMKIDVEGHEAAVIRGASDYLSDPQAPVLMVEFTKRNAEAAGSSTEILFQMISGLGYSMYRVKGNGRLLVQQRSTPSEDHCNLVAIKLSSAWLRQCVGAGIVTQS